MVAQKDQAAFGEFYRRYASGLFAMIFKILNEQREAEDALQDALVRIWKNADTYDAGRSSVFTWAVMISRHRALDRLRAKMRHRKADEAIVEEFANISQEDIGTGSYATEQKEERERVREALMTLPADQRKAVEYAFFKGLTHEEVAAQLAAPLGTVKARIRRGLLALRAALQKP